MIAPGKGPTLKAGILESVWYSFRDNHNKLNQANYNKSLMNDPAASGRSIRQGLSFKSRSKLRGMKPTGGNRDLSGNFIENKAKTPPIS